MGSLTLQDAIGLRGESIFSAALTKLYGRPEPLFNPRFLGEKYPSVDYIGACPAYQPDFHSISRTKSYYFKKYHGFGIGLTLGNSIHCFKEWR